MASSAQWRLAARRRPQLKSISTCQDFTFMSAGIIGIIMGPRRHLITAMAAGIIPGMDAHPITRSRTASVSHTVGINSTRPPQLAVCVQPAQQPRNSCGCGPPTEFRPELGQPSRLSPGRAFLCVSGQRLSFLRRLLFPFVFKSQPTHQSIVFVTPSFPAHARLHLFGNAMRRLSWRPLSFLRLHHFENARILLKHRL